MRVGVIDVGSNTIRLLVVSRGAGGLVREHADSVHVGLGVEMEDPRGISKETLDEAASCTRGYARVARELGAEAVQVLVTAPGRQAANAGGLVATLRRAAAGAAVRVLSADEEARLAYEGAVALARDLPESIAVCDVGGGSTQVAVGTPSSGPVWSRSLAVGSLTLTLRFLPDDPPRKDALLAARAELERHFERFTPPLARAALATGGSTRALRRLVGPTLGAEHVASALHHFSRRRSSSIARSIRIAPWRARTLLAGTLILAETQRRLGIPLELARGGVREGAAFELIAELEAA